MKEYYVDKRIGEVVLNLNISYLAPELYYKYLESPDDTFFEKWYGKDNKVIEFYYTKSDYEHFDVGELRKLRFQEYNFVPLYLISYSVPKEEFIKTIKHFYPEEVEE